MCIAKLQWRRASALMLLGLGVMVVSGCSNDDGDGQALSAATTAVAPAAVAPEAAAPAGDSSTTTSSSAAPSTTATRDAAVSRDPLPVKEGPRRETTHGVPHVQVDAEPVPELVEELRRRVYSIPGVQDRPSEISVPGTQALWLADDVEIAHPEVFLVPREFGHIHPDGSLHMWMPIDRAYELTEKKWGELHPFVGRADFWDGMVMIYTPETPENLDVTVQLIVDAYNFITGSELDPASY